jgi:hypothetical protein
MGEGGRSAHGRGDVVFKGGEKYDCKEMGNQLWAGEMPDSNPGLQDNSQAHYH